MKELTVIARVDQLDYVLQFINLELNEYGCPKKERMQIAIAVEEIYVNIAQYAYAPKVGTVIIRFWTEYEPMRFTIQFVDGGKPYNPLTKPDPDISLDAEKRGIGGLGVFIVKKNMDDVRYEYMNGKNVFTISKKVVTEVSVM